MKAWSGPLLATLLAAPIVAQVGVAQADDKPALRVCLQSRQPPLSFQSGDGPRGFDVALIQVIADRLGRTAQVQWFVSRDDPDANPTKEANALLSDGHCQLWRNFR